MVNEYIPYNLQLKLIDKMVHLIFELRLVLLFAFGTCFVYTSDIIRQTQNGLVEGVEQYSSLGQKYFAFRGIPFAEPPITGMDPYTGDQVDRRFKVYSFNLYFKLYDSFRFLKLRSLLGVKKTPTLSSGII